MFELSPHFEPCIRCGKSTEATCANPAPFCDVCASVQSLVNQMEEDRKSRDFEASDFVRKSLQDELGITVRNTKDGPYWILRHRFND